MAQKLMTAVLCVFLFLSSVNILPHVASAHRILNNRHGIASESLSVISGRSLQATGADKSEIIYCFPYYLIYEWTGNAFTQCLSIVDGAIKGTGDVKDECYSTLYPLYGTFTPTEMMTTISNWNKCLFRNGYTITAAAADKIAASKVPTVTKRVTGSTTTTTGGTTSSGGGSTNTPTQQNNQQNNFNNNINNQANTNRVMNTMQSNYDNFYKPSLVPWGK